MFGRGSRGASTPVVTVLVVVVAEELGVDGLLAEEALAALPGNAGVARDRMRLWRDFHGFILENLETIRARWTERTGGEGEAPSRPSDPSGTPPPSSDQAEPEGGA